MSARRNQTDGRAPTKPGTPSRSLELFMTQLAEIAPESEHPISPQSGLISDLGFDSLAFGRLALLLYEHYEVGGLSTSSMRSAGHLTVEKVFRHYILGDPSIDSSPK
ncbi:MAG TPA: acyl carrier protein [Solirubrobacterales bacterium]